MTATPEAVAGELLPVLRELCAGEYAVAIGGSHAKGSSDALSDVDVYLFARTVLPGPERTLRVASVPGACEVSSWGRDEPFVEGGTDFVYRGQRVECWLRNPEQVEATIAACKQGRIQRDPVVWTVMGFFNYVVLADVRAMRIVEDPYGLLARWKAEVGTYPERLRRMVLHRFMQEAAFWPDNFHYETAVERADVIYTSGIVQQVLHALIQVVFALNGEYFPGEKKLVHAMASLPVQPHAFAARVQGLVAPGSAPDVPQLREQRRELGALVAEMAALVTARRGAARGTPGAS